MAKNTKSEKQDLVHLSSCWIQLKWEQIKKKVGDTKYNVHLRKVRKQKPKCSDKATKMKIIVQIICGMKHKSGVQ